MRKFTLFLMSLFLMLGTTMAQNYSLTETGISSEELNAKTAPTLIAIKNLSATNNYYFVGNTGATPYSQANFSDAAVFVWQPVQEGVAGSYYLMKLDGTYMQATSPKDFGTVDNAAVFTTTNPTTAGTGSANFNGDGDSQGYIVDEALLVRFVNAAGTWINVQNGDSGTPTYNSGLGGWTIHHVYAVEEAAVEPEPEPISGLVLELTSEQIGTAPYQLSDEDAAKVFALSDMTVALKVTTPASMNNIRYALFCTSDPTQAANTDAKGTNSAYVAYGTSNQNIGYLASCKTGDRFTSGTIPLATEDVVLVYVISPTNNLFQIYMNGSLIKEWNNAHSDGFMSGYEIATPQMVKADYENANIYIGGGMTAEGTYEVFPGTITGVEVHNGVLSAEEIADIFATTEPEPETPFKVVAVTPSEAVAELSTITVEFSEEIAGEQDIMDTMNYIYVGSTRNACNFTVEGKVLTITLWTPITAASEYALYVPAGVGITRASNGEAVTVNGEIKFTVEEPAAEFEVVAVTPSEAVAELNTITIEFSEEIAGEQDIMDTMNYIYVGSRTNACNFTVDGKVLTITLWTPITAAGEYALYVPASVGITRASNGEAVTINGEITFTVAEPVVEPEKPEVPTVDGQIVGLKNVPEAVTAPTDIKTGYYLLKQANEGAISSGNLGYIKADYENVNSAVSIATKAPTAGANNEATYIWFVEKADDGSITIATANKKAYWQAPWQGQKNLAAEPSALGIVTESVTLGGKTATPTEGTAIISNNNPDNLSLVHYSGGKLGSWNDANPASVWFVEFYEISVEDLNVLSEVDITYNYTHNGETVKTETFTVAKGTAMPAVTLPYGVATKTVLPETATETATYEIVCELDLAQLPFAPAASYGEIEKWYHMTIHSKEPDYLYYAEGQEYIPLNVESLPEENLDAYAWAFVGNPFTGYQIVNKLAGEGKILSSANPDGNDGNTFPILIDATAVPAGNNSHWDVSTSTFAENGFFIAQHGTNYRMNNRDHKLAYWTGGADDGSTFLLTEYEITVVEPEEPTTPALNETAVFDFANNVWGIPGYDMVNFRGTKTVETYTDGTKDVTIDPTKNKGEFYYENGYLRIAKPGSKIVLPAFDFAVEKIEVIGHASATSYPNVDMNVYVGSTAVSTACTGSTETYTYEIAADNQAAGNVYELVIGSNGGNYSSVMYITYVKVYPAENKLEAPAFDLTSGVYVGEQTVNVHSATTDLEGVTDVTYYYTTDGNEPTVEDEETDGEITITESCTLKVIVELTYGDKVYVSASSSAEYIITEEVTYHRATSVESGSYFIVADGNMAAPIEGTSLPTVEVAVEGNDVTAPAYYAVTLEETAGGYYIKDVNGNYIYNTMMTPHKLSFGTSAPMDAWTITIADDENSTATIMCNGYALALNNGVFCTVSLGGTDVPVMPTLYGTHATGINEAVVNGEAIESIYDLQGRKIEKVTNGGIYIVNGKKILVK